MSQTAPTLVGTRARTLPASTTAALDARLKELAARGESVVNLTSGEVSFPTPQQVTAAADDAIAEGFTRYTAVAGMTELRRAASAWLASQHGLQYTPDQIVVSNGAKQALFNAFTVLLDPGDEVLLPAPYWVSFPHMISLANGVPVAVATTADGGFKVTPDALRAYASPRSKVLLLNNATNPTGTVYSDAELVGIADAALSLGLAIVSDEIYDELVYPPVEFTSMASLGDEVAGRTILINGVSKTFAMTGWRIGYAAAPGPVVKAMTAVQGHTTSAPSSISQRAALAALTDPTIRPELARRRAALDQRRRALIAGLASVPGLRVPAEPAGAFFVLADVTDSYGCRTDGTVIDSAATYAQALLDSELVGVVPGEDFGAPGYVRISYVDTEQRLAEGITRLSRFAAGLHSELLT